MTRQTQALESTISGLQERLSNLASRNPSNHSLSNHSSTSTSNRTYSRSPSPDASPGNYSPTIGLDNDELDVDDQYEIDENDYDEDWKLKKHEEDSGQHISLANGRPLLLAVAGTAEVGPHGKITGTLALNRIQ